MYNENKQLANVYIQIIYDVCLQLCLWFYQ